MLESPWGLSAPQQVLVAPSEHGTLPFSPFPPPRLSRSSHSRGRTAASPGLPSLPLPTSSPVTSLKQKSGHFTSLFRSSPATFCHPKRKISCVPGVPKPEVPQLPRPPPGDWDPLSAHQVYRAQPTSGSLDWLPSPPGIFFHPPFRWLSTAYPSISAVTCRHLPPPHPMSILH